MTPINLPAPMLSQDPPGAAPEIELPVSVKLPTLMFPSGLPVTQADVTKLGAFVYRRTGGTEEIWNEGEQLWQSPPADLNALTPLPLTFKDGASEPWAGVLVAAGMKDKAGVDRFVKAASGQPRYVVRAWARLGKDGVEFEGLSPPTAELAFVSAADNQRFVVELDPPKGREAERARMQLRTASRTPIGWIEIRAADGEVEIVKCDGGGGPLSSVLLADDGSIHLRPATGREIVLDGDLRARRVRYERFSTGVLTELG
jgi:hypothetical protein